MDPVPTPTPAPTVPSGAYLGVLAVIPGTVEAEEFDYGGEGEGYHDTSAGNSGGVRTETAGRPCPKLERVHTLPINR